MIGSAQTIGTCSLCGGPVQLPAIWMAVVPPTPTCGRCGAVQKSSFGPVIEMEPPRPPVTTLEVGPGTSTTRIHCVPSVFGPPIEGNRFTLTSGAPAEESES